MPMNISSTPPMEPVGPQEPRKSVTPATKEYDKPLPVPSTPSVEKPAQPIRATRSPSADPRLTHVAQRALLAPKIPQPPLPKRPIPSTVQEATTDEVSPSLARHARFNSSLIDLEPSRPFSGTTLPSLPKVLVPSEDFVDKINQDLIDKSKIVKENSTARKFFMTLSGVFGASHAAFVTFAAITGFLILGSNPFTLAVGILILTFGVLASVKSLHAAKSAQKQKLGLLELKKELTQTLDETKKVKENLVMGNVEASKEYRELVVLKERLYEGLIGMIDESLETGKLPSPLERIATLKDQHLLLIEKSKAYEDVFAASEIGKIVA